MKLTVNKTNHKSKSISASIRKDIEDKSGPLIKNKILAVGLRAISYSPVDTGAYVESFSFVPSGSGAGRRKTSANKPRNQSAQAKKEIAIKNLTSDISKIDIFKKNVVLRNRAAHSLKVENKYNVFGKLKGYFR